MVDRVGFNRRQLLGVSAAAAAAGISSNLLSSAEAATKQPRASVDVGVIPVAFLLDDNATVIDFAGPWEVFQDSGGDGRGFKLFTVAPERKLIRATGGMTIMPDYALPDAPPARVIVIPAQNGGRSGEGVEERVAWIRDRAPAADFVLSVCTGAFHLARTGLLDGLKATTHHQFADEFAGKFPKIELLRNQRFVDNGKFITSGGLSSGIEAALHIVERYFGAGERMRVANYMEYVPHVWTEPAIG